MTNRNLVITGFMGTGKTVAGRLAAARLGRQFVDMDEQIGQRAGMPVSEIFARYGEAHFRRLESELCAELAVREGLVIGTGGGTLVSEANRAAFSSAFVVCLDAALQEVVRRLEGVQDRPLLAGDRRAQIAALLATRREAYAALPNHVDTTGLTPEAVAALVVDRFLADDKKMMKDIERMDGPGNPICLQMVAGGYSTPIWVGSGLLDRLGQFVGRERFAARAAIVTNPTVGRLYGARAEGALRAAGFNPVVIEMPDGEAHKTLDTLRELYDRFVEARLERRSLVVALGGGVVGDVAGFAAATLMRGLPLVQVPTSLLAMVDASIGGKVAVDHPAGKNLIGSYKFPEAVVSDPALLDTLPPEEYSSGMAEAIKHGIIADEGLFDLLDGRPLTPSNLARIIKVKLEIVEQDPFEENVRAHLNLGHTFGHALEVLSGYRMRHGHAVAIGIAVAARLAANTGRASGSTRDRITERLQRNGLPVYMPSDFEPAQVVVAMQADKKVRDGRLRLVLPVEIGRVEMVSDLPEKEILAALDQSRSEER